MNYTKIVGTGSYLPERILTNAELETLIDTSDAWIQERTGIRQRHIAADGETTCDLAEAATRMALETASIASTQIDLIVVATTTPDHVFPSVATKLQERIGAYGCPAFDIQAVCAGFVYALGVAQQFISSGSARCALVVGAETFSRILDWNDRSTCILFGDGAGAVIVEAATEPGIIDCRLHADGRHRELLWVPAGVSQSYEQTRQNAAYVSMRGNEVFKVAVKTLGREVEKTLAAHHLTATDIDWLVPHQANGRIITATAKRIGLPMERVILTVAEHANTSAASVPLALDTGIRDGRIKPGQMLLLEAFGGGFTWGSILLKY